MAAQLFLLEQMQLFPVWRRCVIGRTCVAVHPPKAHRDHPTMHTALSPPSVRTWFGTRQGCYFGTKGTFLDGVVVINFKTYSDCPLSCITRNLPCSGRHPKNVPPSVPNFYSQTEELANSPRAIADVSRACSGHSSFSTSPLCSICCICFYSCSPGYLP